MLFSLKLALASLKAHKLRAILAMLGVFLGALALTGVQHVSMAMVRKAEVEVEKLGPNLFAARAGQVRFARDQGRVAGTTARTFTPADALALRDNLPGVVASAPYVDRTIALRVGDRKIPAQLVATVPAFEQVRNAKPAIGRFFTEEERQDREKVIILGLKIAQRLFNDPQLAIGKQVFFFRAAFRVVGVMGAKGRDLAGTDQDEQVFVPLETYMRRAANQAWISGVYLQIASEASPEALKDSAETLLRSRHGIGTGKKDDFTTLTAHETMRLQDQALNLVQTLGLISSSVSFAVGGLGILSILVLMVQQRRIEIGVRRAMGANRTDIIRQFLFEAGVMSAVGGGLGVLASLVLVTVVYRLGDFPPVYDPVLIIGSLAGSAALGLLAGVYPAWQAAQIEILDVLKG